MNHIVNAADELTIDWFNHALQGELDGACVIDARVERLGTGQLASMVRTQLSFDRETQAPRSVVVKFPSGDASSLGFARALGMYELEVRFYQDLVGLIPDLGVPRCHFADLDSETGGFTLVLEDLSSTTRSGNVLSRSTPDQCAAVLEQLVYMQAPSWNRPEVTQLPWLSNAERTLMLFDQLPAGLAPFLERFGPQLSAEHVALCQSVLPKAGQWARSWATPTVLQHGDFRADNIMFGNTAQAPPVTVIDFQLIRIGPPGVDPAYFLASALDTDIRRAVERDLITEYHKRLEAAGVTDFSFDQCWDAYRQGAIYGVVMFCGIASSVESTERGDRMVLDQIRRYADMALDLDAPAAAGL